MFNDLREYIKLVEELGELKIIEGADWDLEIGAVTEIMARPGTPLLLFDNIKDYPPGYRVVTNIATSNKRISLLLGLPQEEKPLELLKAWREKTKGGFKPMPPEKVTSGPVQENILSGKDVDLFRFPVPRWHEADGGRYIGTGDIVITRDPDDGWVNVSTYRVQVHDKTTATIWIEESHHGNIIRKKYWNKGLACPVVVACGQDPLLQIIVNERVPWGVSEYDYAGWLKQSPIKVVPGDLTGLPIPATAEIALEGEMMPPEKETLLEGPFGEFSGYYVGPAAPVASFRVKSVYHRDNPILHGSPPFRVEPIYWSGRNIPTTAALWDALDKKIPGIKGVWIVEEGLIWMLVISIQQQFAGHAKETALAARSAGAPYRFIIVVDDDIDPSNMSEVLWALATRCNPEIGIDVVRGLRSIVLDPSIHPEKRARGENTTSTALIDACKPYSWINDFPQPVRSSPELLARVKDKFLL